MARHRHNKLAVGLAVYNGQRYLAQAIDSILCQTFGDFELIIADNASVDSTQEICRDYAARDRRVRYIRNVENVGVAENFNIVFRASNSRYFRWAADDDAMEPDYLRRCVEMLDGDPTLAAAHSLTRLIDQNNNAIGFLPAPLQCQSPVPAERYLAFVDGRTQAIWSVMRSDYIARVRPHAAFPNSENYFQAELALMGRFGFIQEYLFNQRMHPECCTAMHLSHEEQVKWWRQRRFTSAYFTPLIQFYMQSAAIWNSPVNRAQKLICLRHLACDIGDYLGGIVHRNLYRLYSKSSLAAKAVACIAPIQQLQEKENDATIQ